MSRTNYQKIIDSLNEGKYYIRMRDFDKIAIMPEYFNHREQCKECVTIEFKLMNFEHDPIFAFDHIDHCCAIRKITVQNRLYRDFMKVCKEAMRKHLDQLPKEMLLKIYNLKYRFLWANFNYNYETDKFESVKICVDTKQIGQSIKELFEGFNIIGIFYSPFNSIPDRAIVYIAP